MPFFSARPSAVFNVRAKRGLLPFLTRQIITTGYVAGGYKDSVAWRNVNSNDHATDTCTNRGDLLQEATNYTSGAHNRNNAFIWGTNGTGTQGVGAFTSTSCFNMRNNTTLTKTPQMNTALTVGDSGTLQADDLDGNPTYSWQTGNQGSNSIQKFNLTTEQHMTTFGTSLSQAGTGASTHFSEFFGYFWAEGSSASVDAAGGAGKVKFVYATETQSTPSGNPSFHGQQKGLPSKVGKGYAGNEGTYNGGNSFRVWNYSTESVQTTVSKPIQDSGEENFIQGQSKGYMLGMYGAPGPSQSNRSFLLTYATNSGSELGASGQPSGTASGTGASGTCCPSGLIGGRSSGHGFWRD